MDEHTWMSSSLESEWHLVPLVFTTFRPPAACGRFLAGSVHRRLLSHPPDGPRCAACKAEVSDDSPPRREMSRRPDPPGIRWPDEPPRPAT